MRTPEQEDFKGSSLGMHQRGSQGANFQEGAKRTVISFAVSLSNATRSPNHLSDNCLATVQPSQSSSTDLTYYHSKRFSSLLANSTSGKSKRDAVGIIHYPQEVWVILKNSLSATADSSREGDISDPIRTEQRCNKLTVISFHTYLHECRQGSGKGSLKLYQDS